MVRVLFVCYGNIGRSQMAEAFYNKYSKSGGATSAGVSYNIGEKYKHPAEDIIQVMLEENIDISKNHVKAVNKQMVNEAEKIVVLCDLEDCPRYLLDSGKVQHSLMPDPYGVSIEYVRAVRGEIKTMVLDLIDSENKF